MIRSKFQLLNLDRLHILRLRNKVLRLSIRPAVFVGSLSVMTSDLMQDCADADSLQENKQNKQSPMIKCCKDQGSHFSTGEC